VTDEHLHLCLFAKRRPGTQPRRGEGAEPLLVPGNTFPKKNKTRRPQGAGFVFFARRAGTTVLSRPAPAGQSKIGAGRAPSAERRPQEESHNVWEGLETLF